MLESPAIRKLNGAGDTSADRLIDLGSTWATVMAHPLILISCMLVALSLGAAFLAFIPPLYEGSALIMIDPKPGGILANRPAPTDANSDSAVVESEVEILRSAQIARAVVDAEGLADDPTYLREGLARRLWTSLGLSWLGLKQPLPDNPGARRERAAEALQRSLKIKRIGTTYVVSVDANLATPKDAARISNGYARAYIDARLADARANARQTSDMLNERALELQHRVSEAELAVENLRLSNSGSDAASAKVKLKNAESTARTYRELYEKLLESFAESNVSALVSQPRARIVSEAVEPLEKSWPSTTGTFAGALAIGFAAGALIALWSERRSPS